MLREVFLRAATTGVFCAVFAVVVKFAAPMLGLVDVVLVSATSGFLGSLFATFVLKYCLPFLEFQ